MSALWSVSLIGGVMILVIMILRAFLRNRVHRTVFLVLWLLAAVRLAVPVVTSSSASVYNFIPENGKLSAFVSREPTGIPVVIVGDTVSPEVESKPQTHVGDIQPSAEGNVVVERYDSKEPVDIAAILTALWAVGCGGCFLYFLWVHIRGRLRYRFAVPEEGPEFLGNIRLKRSDAVSTPIVYGFFRPVILLPVDFPKKDSPEYEQILFHELTHVRSGDLWYKLFMLLITCVHWFNPLVWIMLSLSTQDLEIRCDARVIRKLGEKKTYAMTLVQAEVQRDRHFAEAAFAFSLTELRLKAIAKAKVYLPRSILLFTILAMVLTCCFATGPVEKTEKVDSEPATTVPAIEPTEVFTVAPTEETTEEATTEVVTGPPPTVCLDEEQELTYLLNSGYEEYGSVIEVSLKEGQRKTFALNLPQYTIFSVSAEKDMATVTYEYSSDEELMYLTVDTYTTGSLTVYAYVAGRQWMEVRVSASFDLYYRVPDAWRFEEYGGGYTAYMTEGGSRIFRLDLPAGTVITTSSVNPDFFTEGRGYNVSSWYDDETGQLNVKLSTNHFGWVHLYFYVDGLFWYEIDVGVSARPANNISSSYGSMGPS